MPDDVQFDPEAGTWYSPSTGQRFDATGKPIAAAPSAPAAPAGPAPTSGSATSPLGNTGYFQVSYQEPNPNYDPDQAKLYGPLYKVPQYITKTQFLPDKSFNSGANNVHTTERLIDPNQIAVEQLRAQNQIDIANLQNKVANAKNDTDREIAANALKQKYDEMAQQGGLTAAQLTGSFNGTPTLDARKFGFDQFKYLSDLASNPRNFMQDFFVRRGFQSPAGVDRYSNTYGMNPLIPGFLSGALALGGGGQPSHGAASVIPSNVGGSTTPAGQVSPSGIGYSPSGKGAGAPVIGSVIPGQVQLPSTGADLARLTALGIHNFSGVPTSQAQNPNPGQPFTLASDPVSPQEKAWSAAHPNATQEDYMKSPSALAANPSGREYARGGIVPEPVAGVGLHSGHRYMFGEKGPEGVVPANYLPKFLQSRHGRQMQMPNEMPMGTTMQGYSEGGMVGYPSNGQDGINMYAVGGLIGDNADTDHFTDQNQPKSSTPNDPANPYSAAFDPYTAYGSDFIGPTTPSGYGPVISQPTETPYSGAPYYGPGDVNNPSTPEPSAAPSGGNVLAPKDTPEVMSPTRVDPFPARTPTGEPPQASMPPGGWGTLTPTTTPPPSPPAPQPQGESVLPPSAPMSQAFVPTFVPQNGQTAPANVPGALTPRDTSSPGTFGAVVGAQPSAYSTFAPYLPHFLPGEDSPLAAMTDQGIIPPFLGRLFAQQQGAQAFGTNQQQNFDLPSGVPVVSRLAYSQMTPSERMAFQSYISSYGIDPQDYFDYVDRASPHGGTASTPNFGTGIQFNRQ